MSVVAEMAAMNELLFRFGSSHMVVLTDLQLC